MLGGRTTPILQASCSRGSCHRNPTPTIPCIRSRNDNRPTSIRSHRVTEVKTRATEYSTNAPYKNLRSTVQQYRMLTLTLENPMPVSCPSHRLQTRRASCTSGSFRQRIPWRTTKLPSGSTVARDAAPSRVYSRRMGLSFGSTALLPRSRTPTLG